jgi:menaquinol-cytochrome c reductase iron-sulfur subunit
MKSTTKQGGAPNDNARRGFLRKMTALLLGCGAALVPVAAGLVAFMNPLRRRTGVAEAIRVTTLDGLPEDGEPRRFPVVSTRHDGWTRTPEAPVGAVYLRRTGPATVEALNVICPHAGCVVRYVREAGGFECPCHKSSFDLAGRILGQGSPSPRDLDTLEVEVRDDNEVWVRFQNFRTGRTEKVPVG